MRKKYYRKRYNSKSEYGLGSAVIFLIFIYSKIKGSAFKYIIYTSIGILIVAIILCIYKEHKKRGTRNRLWYCL